MSLSKSPTSETDILFFFGRNNLHFRLLIYLLFCYTRLLIPLANYQHMGFVEEGSVDYFKQKFVRKVFYKLVSSNLPLKVAIAIWKLFFRW